jgi:spore coat polysaccharide biosynthesis protein SpsF
MSAGQDLLERAVIIVQARTGATRLPGKVLLPFGGTTLLQHILRRLRLGPLALPIWVATTTLAADDAIAALCAEEGVSCFRGPVDDVLARFVGCLDVIRPEPEVVVRVCADRPFVCAQLLAEMLAFYEEVGRPDYLCNNRPRSFPNGLDLELVRTATLRTALAAEPSALEREHVTLHIYEHPERFTIANYPCPFGNFAWARLVIDTPLDYETLLPAHAALSRRCATYDYRDVLNSIVLEPERFAANQGVPQFGIA